MRHVVRGVPAGIVVKRNVNIVNDSINNNNNIIYGYVNMHRAPSFSKAGVVVGCIGDGRRRESPDDASHFSGCPARAETRATIAVAPLRCTHSRQRSINSPDVTCVNLIRRIFIPARPPAAQQSICPLWTCSAISQATHALLANARRLVLAPCLPGAIL